METTSPDLATLVSARRLMVTGAAGFIGAHLVAALARLGAERVVALDREPLTANPLLRGLALPTVVQELVALGDCAPGAIRRAVRGVDAVLHLAAVKYRPQAEPLVDIVRPHALGTAALVEACAEADVSKVVFASSLYAYGRMRGEPLDEGERPEPRTVYGLSKRFGEELCGIGGGPVLRATVLRYMFVYGPGQTPKHGYPSVIVKNFLRMLGGERPLIPREHEPARVEHDQHRLHVRQHELRRRRRARARLRARDLPPRRPAHPRAGAPLRRGHREEPDVALRLAARRAP